MTIEEFRRHKTKKSKYGNRASEYGGAIYASKKEALYAKHLDILRKAVSDTDRVIAWQAQVPYEIWVRHKFICKYLLDFKVYYADGRIECIDIKGGNATKTPIYRLKKKLVEAIHCIVIKEI